MSNTDRYNHDISHGNIDYKISIESFKNWLRAENLQETFNQMLKDRELTLYDIALDFSIPVSMVKYFKQSA